jgi:hypothetical protein
MSEAQGRVARDLPRAIQNLSDAVRWDAKFTREFGRAHFELLKFYFQMFAGMDRGKHNVF